MVSFIIPYLCDSPERAENLAIVRRHLRRVSPDAEIRIVETTRTKEFFHRTRLINEGVKQTKCDIIVVYDADVLLTQTQHEAAVKALERYDFCLPFDGVTLDVPHELFGEVEKSVGLETLLAKQPVLPVIFDRAKGGAVFFHRSTYIKGGMENENCKSWGFEDCDRYFRFLRLGYKLMRLEGPLFHLTHPRGDDSSPSNPFCDDNNREFQKVYGMPRAELLKYISTWSWLKGVE